ncbi:hypothetical protein [Streptomyces sp. MNP-20]|uniref:hypothetical protein n=1 Tax=Streptomyces sp. MNP-20 TaxID=2721165 RepID=UPI001552C073|nr:hypothetical protein [Streptomyces sp. MNP-20]
MPAPITLMAAADLRDALTAAQSGDLPAAAHHLCSIDPVSWQGITERLAAVGACLPDLLTHPTAPPEATP